MSAIAAVQRLADRRFVFTQILHRDQTAVRTHVGDDAPRGHPFVEIAWVGLDARQRGSELGLFETLADHVETPIAQKDAPAFGPRLKLLKRVFVVKHSVKKRRDNESLGGEFSSRLDELTPFQLAVAFVD